MPKPGYKSLTIPEKIFNKIYKQYEKEQDDYKEKGVFSFSGYVTQLLIEQKENQDFKFIKELLVVCNSLLIGMSDTMLGGDRETAKNNLLGMKMLMFQMVKEMRDDEKL
jgi:hypothetical protein